MKPTEPLPTVLVVDDEVRSQEAMRRTLDEDFNVLTASDADEAREKIERFEVSVILCDHLLAKVRNAVEAQALPRDTNRLHLELRSGTPMLRQRAAGNLARARSVFDFDRIERGPAARWTPFAKWRRAWRVTTSACWCWENRAPARNCWRVPCTLQPARRRCLCGGKLRRHSRHAVGIRTVRPQTRRLHGGL